MGSAGFKALDPTYLTCYSDVPLALPTLHIYGDGDNHVVPGPSLLSQPYRPAAHTPTELCAVSGAGSCMAARSKALAETFADPAIYVHAGG